MLLIGDSITFGLASEPTGPGYATLLSERLADTHRVKNLGREGASSLDWAGSGFPGGDLFVLLAEPALPADIVTILLGTNDAAGSGELRPVSPESYGNAIRTLIRRCLAAGAGTVILMAPPPAWFEKPENPSRLSGYQTQVTEICGTDARVICGPDLFHLMSKRPPDFQAFDVHPTARGHEKIANALEHSILENDCR